MYLIQVSLGITCVSLILRFCLLKKYSKIIFLQNIILKYLLSKPLCYGGLRFCHNTTLNLFTGNPHLPRYVLIILSGFLVGFGIIYRIFVTQGFLITGQHLVLFVLGINGIFRGVVNLGMLVHTSNFWKQLVERAFQSGGRNAGRAASSAYHPIQNNNNPNDNTNRNGHQDQNGQSHQYSRRSTVWNNALGVSGFLGSFATVYVAYDTWEKRTENPSLQKKCKALEQEVAEKEKENRRLTQENRRYADDKEHESRFRDYIIDREARRCREYEDTIDQMRKEKK